MILNRNSLQLLSVGCIVFYHVNEKTKTLRDRERERREGGRERGREGRREG